ncbi:hypothetical protein D3C80_1967740 [compost metagenome]
MVVVAVVEPKDHYYYHYCSYSRPSQVIVTLFVPINATIVVVEPIELLVAE